MVVERQPIQDPPAAFGQFVPWHPTAADLASPAATDDWPYLYLRQRTIPPDYLLVIRACSRSRCWQCSVEAEGGRR